MGIFDFFKKKKIASEVPEAPGAVSKEDIFKMMFEKMAQQSPSVQFASGSVFDIARQQRQILEQIIQSNNAMSLLQWFVRAYDLFCDNPSVVGFTPGMVNKSNNDVKINEINADIIPLQNGDAAALCYMPVISDEHEARIIGIVLSGKGDGYYYCMLDKEASTYSDVIRNKAIHGIEKIGEVNGRGFELMNHFMTCIQADFYSK